MGLVHPRVAIDIATPIVSQPTVRTWVDSPLHDLLRLSEEGEETNGTASLLPREDGRQLR